MAKKRKLKWKREGNAYSGYATVYFHGKLEIGIVAPTLQALADAWDLMVSDIPLDRNKVKPVRITKAVMK